MSAIPPEPPDDSPAPPPAPPPPAVEGVVCPRCGTPAEPYQEYCLECGLRLPVPGGVIHVLSTAWQRRVPWYPGDWIWPVLLGLLIAAAGATAAILATRDDDNGPSKRIVATGPATVGTGEETTTDGGAGEPPPTDTGAEPPPAEPPPTEEPPPPPASGGIVEWPAGQDGWTIVLASLPESSGRGPAQRAAQKAANAGLTDVGVLNSSDFSSLHPGYWVVFSGIFNSQSEARAGLDTARASYPQAYARQIAQ